MENAMARGPNNWWKEISCMDVICILGTIILEFVKLASAKASIAAEIYLEVTKLQQLDSRIRNKKIEEYHAAYVKYAIGYFVLETIFMYILLKGLLPVASAVQKALRRENDTLRKNVAKLKREGANYREKWREANIDKNNLKIEKSALERRALDAEEKLGQAMLKLERAHAEAVNAHSNGAQQATVIPEDVTDT